MSFNIFPLPGSKLKKGSAECCGPCPKCGGGDDRFITWPESGRFWCRRCGWSGDEIQFLRDTENLNFVDACNMLGINSHDKLKKKEIFITEGYLAPKPSTFPNEKWCSMAGAFAITCSDLIFKHPKGLNYALARGLNEETIQKFGIGWNPKDRYPEQVGWGFPEEINEVTGKPRKLKLSAGLIIPTLVGNRIVSIKIRRFPWKEGNKPSKYTYVKGSSSAPLMLPGGPAVVVVESELDALLVAQEAKSLATAVALRSASNKPDVETTKLLRDAKVILVATDFDEAGIVAWGWWKKYFPNAFYWPVSVGKDVGEMVEAGVSAKEWVKTGIRDFISRNHPTIAP